MQGNRDGEPVASEGVAPRCDGCGRVGVDYRLSLTNLQRPFAPHHRHYCACCWDALRTKFADEPQGAPTAVEEFGNDKESPLKVVETPDGTAWKTTSIHRVARE